MGGRLLVLIALIVFAHDACEAVSELALLNYVPRELRGFFNPEAVDEPFHPGIVSRHRRSSGSNTLPDGLPTYTLYDLGGSPCIYAEVDAYFYIEYRTLRRGILVTRIDLPQEPEVSGSCVRDGDTAVLTLTWNVFNFSLVFTENPEGNSYYLNRAMLRYNQSREWFPNTDYIGPVYLETRRGWNYYFTPLGKSYICEMGEDQGPLKLYNNDDEKAGNMTLYNTKFQPFVKRAKGEWGPEVKCLPKNIQVLREDVVPYATALVFTFFYVIVMAVYGIYRYFRVKKADYQFYEQSGQGAAGDGVEGHEMTYVAGEEGIPVDMVENGYAKEEPQQQTSYIEEQQPGQNPFRQDATKNPFKQGYGATQ